MRFKRRGHKKTNKRRNAKRTRNIITIIITFTASIIINLIFISGSNSKGRRKSKSAVMDSHSIVYLKRFS